MSNHFKDYSKLKVLDYRAIFKKMPILRVVRGEDVAGAVELVCLEGERGPVYLLKRRYVDFATQQEKATSFLRYSDIPALEAAIAMLKKLGPDPEKRQEGDDYFSREFHENATVGAEESEELPSDA